MPKQDNHWPLLDRLAQHQGRWYHVHAPEQPDINRYMQDSVYRIRLAHVDLRQGTVTYSLTPRATQLRAETGYDTGTGDRATRRPGPTPFAELTLE